MFALRGFGRLEFGQNRAATLCAHVRSSLPWSHCVSVRKWLSHRDRAFGEPTQCMAAVNVTKHTVTCRRSLKTSRAVLCHTQNTLSLAHMQTHNCTHTHTHTHVLTHTHTHTHTHTDIYTHTNAPTLTNTHTNPYTHAQITKPPASGIRLGLTLDLAGVGLCAKSSVYELLNFTVQRVRASMLRTARELQVRSRERVRML